MVNSPQNLQTFYKNKKVLITGFNGFKGSWLTSLLNKMGATCFGFSERPKDYFKLQEIIEIEKICNCSYGDINNFDDLFKVIKDVQPDIIFHLAAQPLVRESIVNPKETFHTNVIGTLNLYECVRQIGVEASVINITTDKVYLNNEWGYCYRENDALGGNDPYSASKACSELISQSYNHTYFNSGSSSIKCLTVRAGNVIGGGDFSPDRLMVDMVNSFLKGDTLSLRYPNATRPWQYVLDVIYGYLLLPIYLNQQENPEYTSFNLAGSDSSGLSVMNIATMTQKILGKGVIQDVSNKDHPKESQALQLDSSLANNILGWKNLYSPDQFLQESLNWYNSYYNDPQQVKSLTQELLNNYLSKAKDYYGNRI
jgi:CDP-glucose 4,6-dehydratase